jgi:hypothetical protein
MKHEPYSSPPEKGPFFLGQFCHVGFINPSLGAAWDIYTTYQIE